MHKIRIRSYWDEEGDIVYKTGHRKYVKRPEGHKGELTIGVELGLLREEQVAIQA